MNNKNNFDYELAIPCAILLFLGFMICFVVIHYSKKFDQNVGEPTIVYLNELQSKTWYENPNENSFRDLALKQKLNDCMSRVSGADYIAVEGNDSFFHPAFLPDNVLNAFKQNEADCSKEIIQPIAIANQQEASALTYYLIKKGVSVPDDYKKFAKQDDVALANINLN
jgi:hypothetical protein